MQLSPTLHVNPAIFPGQIDKRQKSLQPQPLYRASTQLEQGPSLSNSYAEQAVLEQLLMG